MDTQNAVILTYLAGFVIQWYKCSMNAKEETKQFLFKYVACSAKGISYLVPLEEELLRVIFLWEHDCW